MTDETTAVCGVRVAVAIAGVTCRFGGVKRIRCSGAENEGEDEDKIDVDTCFEDCLVVVPREWLVYKVTDASSETMRILSD